MKTVTYLEQEFEVPDWTTHVAADSDGEVWAFDSEPVTNKLDSGVTIYFGTPRSAMVGNLNVSTYPVKAL